MKKLHVLAVGDFENYGYHPFAEVAEVLQAQFEQAGVKLTCTGDRQMLRYANVSPYDAVISYLDAWEQMLEAEAEEGLVRFVSEGGGFVAVHCGISPENPGYRSLIGARFVEHPPIQTIPIRVSDSNHPIALALEDFTLDEELYRFEFSGPDDRRVFLSTEWEGQPLPFAWTRQEGAGRVVYYAPGHTADIFRHSMAMKALIACVKWAGGKTRSMLPG